MSTSPSPYSTEQLEQLARILEKTAPRIAIDRDNLNGRLFDLLCAVGRADDGSAYAIAFREPAALDPSHAELAERFRAIAAAKDPLNPKLCSAIVLTELNQAAQSSG